MPAIVEKAAAFNRERTIDDKQHHPGERAESFSAREHLRTLRRCRYFAAFRQGLGAAATFCAGHDPVPRGIRAESIIATSIIVCGNLADGGTVAAAMRRASRGA
jgi:hypothetical protein